MQQAMADRDHEAARAHAKNLKEWLGKGGFLPQGVGKHEADERVAMVLRWTAYLDGQEMAR
jgi:hypothetical protein